MELMDPTVPGQQVARKRAPAFADLGGLTIGLLSNGKVNADHLIQATANRLIAKYRGSTLKIVYKHHASEPASTELLTNLSHEADYIITAAGD